ncbi:hypothetical protein D0Z07_4918 [Hyphodiscus hymeniophilus]|uniref:CFEM domain-containing protein n=1 Tax=Hyphodiscus hymeniophilus TaxID=353542 RepID=A0A9P6VJP9_9HELO|nr:hypothetical protein D0Z07_4918 [Hyphodiscus hymeniophilus]
MKFLRHLAIAGLAAAQSSTSSKGTSGPTSDISMSSTAASTPTSPEYTITALPAVQSAPSCVFNCLIPIGLADPSGCDDVTEDCACLSAPADVLDFLTECVNTVCTSSTISFGASATRLYQSYCTSVYGTAAFNAAFAAESSADVAAAASSSIASAEASKTSSGPVETGVTTSSSSASASASGKSGSVVWSPSLLTVGMFAIGGLTSLTVL